jgi:hypothetical protein
LNPLYPNSTYPDDPALMKHLVRCAHDFSARITRDGTKCDGLSDYGTKYFKRYLADTPGFIARSVFTLAWAVHESGKKLEDTELVDHGAGIGMLVMFARLCGFGRVIYTDNHQGMLNDAKVLTEHFGLQADSYCLGELPECIKKQIPTLPHRTVISINVIEHVYDAFELIHNIGETLAGSSTFLILTYANPRNPIIRRNYTGVQRIRENHGLQSEQKGGATLKSFVQARGDIISAAAPDLETKDMHKLASLTRGMRKEDIEGAVSQFLASGMFPDPPDHPTNTCDPYTGSWEERLIDPKRYQQALVDEGFRTRLLAGPYFGGKSKLKRFFVPVANVAIRMSGPLNLHLAKYFMAVGTRKTDE